MAANINVDLTSEELRALLQSRGNSIQALASEIPTAEHLADLKERISDLANILGKVDSIEVKA